MPFLSLALSLAASAATAADNAGNRIEPLIPAKSVKPGDPQPVVCAADKKWCAFARNDEDDRGGAAFEIYDRPDAPAPIAIRSLTGETDQTRYTVWPHIVRLADGSVLIGAEEYRFTGYSGGGGSVSILHLFRVEPGKGGDALTEIFGTTLSAGVLIRACFGERDMKDRRGACHDEYDFSGTVSLDPTPVNGMPRFVVQTLATTYPGNVSRNEDSLANGPLKKSDLVRKRREDCSYRRVFTYIPEQGGYAPDTELPDCSEFTVP